MPFSRRKSPYNEAALYEYAIGALARRARAVAEMKRLLRQRITGQENGEVLVEAVIGKLKEQRYLNDTHFAAAYCSYRREKEHFGRRRVIADLKTKGVHGEIIEKSVNAAYEGISEERLAREHLARKRMQKPADTKGAARVFRTLMRAGFTSRTIFSILKEWDVADEVITALEGEDTP
ncbi:MAG: regulatory protein RecX [Terriglobales bacterium]|jgi:regulatory protein